MGKKIWNIENYLMAKELAQSALVQEVCMMLRHEKLKILFETIKISMDGRGRATDNIMIERFFRSYKWERLYLLYPETVREVKEITWEYMKHYNYERDHQGLSDVTPSSVYFYRNKAVA